MVPQVVPFRSGNALFEVVQEVNNKVSNLWVKGGYHNNVEAAGGRLYDSAINEFIELARKNRTPLQESWIQRKEEEERVRLDRFSISSSFSIFSFSSSKKEEDEEMKENN